MTNNVLPDLVEDYAVHWQEFLTATHSWFWELDDELKYKWLSPGSASYLSQPPEQLLGQPLEFDALDTQGLEARNWLLLQRSLAVRKPFHDFIYRVRTADGVRRWHALSGQPNFAANGVFMGYIGSGRDASEQMERQIAADTALLSVNARVEVAALLQDVERPLADRCRDALTYLFTFDDMAEHQRGGMFLRDPHHEQLELFVVAGNFDADFLTRDNWVPLGHCLCGRAARDGRTIVSNNACADHCHERSFPGLPRHGYYVLPLMVGAESIGVLFLHTSLYPSRDPQRLTLLEQLTALFTQAVMIERSRQMLIAARNAAEAAAKTKGEFIANISHELRTPLNGIIGMSEILLMTELDDDQQGFARTVLDSANSLLKIVNDILDFSRASEGHLVLAIREFDLTTLLATTVAPFETLTRAKGLKLTQTIEGSMPTLLYGDPARLMQVLELLIGNAIKFTHAGEIAIHIRIEQQAEHSVMAHFSVRDTGIGIPDEKQALLFKPFSQADASPTRKFGGTGMGLSLAHELVQFFGGEIGVESEPGHGSVFWFTALLDTQIFSGNPAPPVNAAAN
jgi:signal transduction histidine kinase